MRVVASEPYILRFSKVKDYNAMALKIARIALNLPKNPADGSIVSIKASELNDLLGVGGKSLYNKHLEYKKCLEGITLCNEKGEPVLNESGEPIRPFKIVAYDKGIYRFDLNPQAYEMVSEKRKYIYYDSKNLKELKTTYSIALYEQLKLAQLKSIKPVLLIRKEDLSSKNTSNDLNDLKRTLERSINCVNKTDFRIIETDITDNAIHIYAESKE